MSSTINSGTLNIYDGYSTIQQLNNGTYKEKTSRISSTLGDRVAISARAQKKAKEAASTDANAEAVLAELANYDSCRFKINGQEVDLVKKLEKLAATKFNKFMSTVDKISSSDPETVLKGLAGLFDVKNTEMQTAMKELDYKASVSVRKTMSKVTGSSESDIKKIMENITTKLEVKDAKESTVAVAAATKAADDAK